VRPLYLRGAGGRIPELRRVVVVYQNQIVMEQSFEAALARLFTEGAAQPQQQDSRAVPAQSQPQTAAAPAAGSAAPAAGSAAPAGGAGTPASTALAGEARLHYDRAIEAQRAGDWAKYGDEIRLLGETIRRMER
jgi:uncharacterized membrane protein (UPF0182 family)